MDPITETVQHTIRVLLGAEQDWMFPVHWVWEGLGWMHRRLTCDGSEKSHWLKGKFSWDLPRAYSLLHRLSLHPEALVTAYPN